MSETLERPSTTAQNPVRAAAESWLTDFEAALQADDAGKV